MATWYCGRCLKEFGQDMAACTRHNYRRECQPEDVARALAGVRLARLRLETERGLKEATRKGMN